MIMKKIKIFPAAHTTDNRIGLDESPRVDLESAVNDFVSKLKNKDYYFLQSECEHGITFTVVYED